jgi:glycosyltransferase involved in cell wall biosynthesis
MRILALVYQYPEFDREAGALRFFQILSMLATKHEVSISCYLVHAQTRNRGDDEVRRYRKALADIGVTIMDLNPLQVLRGFRFDALLFEFYKSAVEYLDEARLLQWPAVTIVDSVDVAFNRLLAKARLTGRGDDLREARDVKHIEMRMYRKADRVIAITERDKALLLAEDPALSVGVVPNIHVISPLNDTNARKPASLLFVGGFIHEPNIDAMLYFCREVMPLIWRRVPAAILTIVGDSPPESVRNLACDRVQVVGYVPDLQPYLRSNQISVAPLRYGGGMKGKVGEAMAAGLPVVTTSSGIEGFGLTPGKNVLVGDTPETLASAVVSLLEDTATYETVRRAGWEFVRNRFSPEAVQQLLLEFFDEVAHTRSRRLSINERLKMVIPVRLRYLPRRISHMKIFRRIGKP